MVVFLYMGISIGIAFCLGIIPEGLGDTLLLGAILGVLLAIFHQLTKINHRLSKENTGIRPSSLRRKIPIRK